MGSIRATTSRIGNPNVNTLRYAILPSFCTQRRLAIIFLFQVETMLTLRDSLGDSLLALAASGGNKATFESVYTAVRVKLSPEQASQRMVSV